MARAWEGLKHTIEEEGDDRHQQHHNGGQNHMYAILNVPGTADFAYYGPDTRAACQAWLDMRVATLDERGHGAATMLQRIVSNKEAQSWRFQDGSRVIRAPALHDPRGQCQNCGQEIPLALWPRDFCSACETFCVRHADGTVRYVFTCPGAHGADRRRRACRQSGDQQHRPSPNG
jgi:hypothetical protein